MNGMGQYWFVQLTNKELRKQEAGEQGSESNMEPFVSKEPTSRDVLLGKGKIQHLHHGNLALMGIVSQKYSLYKQTSQFEKTCIMVDIVDIVKQRKGWFQKKGDNDGEWVEVSRTV